MKKQTKKFDWNKRIGKSDKGTSDYVKPAIAYGASGGALVLAIAIANKLCYNIRRVLEIPTYNTKIHTQGRQGTTGVSGSNKSPGD